MQKHGIAVVVVLLLTLSLGRDSRRTFAQDEQPPVPESAARAVVINGIPIPTLGKPVGGVLGFATADGNRQEIQSGPHGTFIFRIYPGARGAVELSLQPENFILPMRETFMPLFVPPGCSIRLSQAGDRIYWMGFQVP